MRKRIAGILMLVSSSVITGSLLVAFCCACLFIFGNYPFPAFIDKVLGKVFSGSLVAFLLSVIAWRACDTCDE